MLKWIKINLPFGPLHGKILTSGKELPDKDSFYKRGLSKPGTLIKVKGFDKYFIIGDINRLRGVCDDCTAFDTDVVVTEYCELKLPKK